MEPAELGSRLGRWASGRGPLYALLAAGLRRLVDEGELPPGTTLPPDRALSSALAVGRGTVIAAYEELRAEGRVERRQGSGTRVAGPASGSPPDTLSAPAFLHLLEPRDGVLNQACAAPPSPPPELIRAFERTLPQLAGITDSIGYHPAGLPALRQAVADDYARRGLPTGPEQIMVTNGGQQALSLIARALVAPGDQVLVEGPSYPGALEAFREEAAVPRALPVGLEGFAQSVRARRAVLAYTVPTFHNPTGSVLPPLARAALVERAAALGVPLVDDEVLARLPFPGQEPPPPLAAYAPRTARGGAAAGSGARTGRGGGLVLTVGSLSKLLWGGLRVGWVRAPAPLVARLARLRTVHDISGTVPTQLAAAELLPRLGEFEWGWAGERAARHDHLRAELARRLPSWEVPPARGGQTLWVRLPTGDASAFAQIALRHGVAVLPGAGLDASGASRPFLRLHFQAPSGELTEVVRRLERAWGAYDPGTHRTGTPPGMAV